MSNSQVQNSLEGIAIIGLSCSFPGANNVEQFWQNLKDGVESISFFSDQELEESGVEPATLSDPTYVKSGFVIEDIDLFDASFFGFNPRESAILDPQQRLFLEGAWEALENAGYDSEQYEGRVGVYAGASLSNYYFNLFSNQEFLKAAGGLQFMFLHGNDKDYLSTRTSYKLNLRGPSITVQTACSTSLVAVSLACQSLLNYQCDMALAGGISLRVPQRAGYLYQEEGVYSPDGHCRAFDARAQGTAIGNGMGIIVLKRLSDAVADGDQINAVIKGMAVNNDGALKIGYTAPSVDGQAEVIAEALAMAGADPDSISYVEAHGTATVLGDPIEFTALAQAFSSTKARQFCGIGSVKTNIGHLGAAAGIAGLIKTVEALKRGMIPASLYFEQPNPNIDFANSPFYVNSTLKTWEPNGNPLRAGVSSFGIGGTNVHVIVEQAPGIEPSGISRPYQLVVLSAKTNAALQAATTKLAEHLKRHKDANLADVAYTLQTGRRTFNHRLMLVCQGVPDAVNALETLDPKRIFTRVHESRTQPVVFMFPGGGAQYVNMGRELYQLEPVFREQVDLCAELLKLHIGCDLRRFLYPDDEGIEEAARRIRQTSIGLPALFVTEYAMAKLWMSFGVRIQAMIGHSLGEYVAACLAEVLSLEDALKMVALRGELFDTLPKGAMLSVPLSEEQTRSLMGNKLSLAAVNGESICLVSGARDAIDEMANLLTEKGLEFRRLQIDVAAHSDMVTPILEPFTDFAKTISLQAPKLPYISNVTGTWITTAEATSPAYWAKHLRQTVRFAEGLEELLKEPERILLEVGPGQTLSTLARQHPDKTNGHAVLQSLRHPQDAQSDMLFLLTMAGKLWLAGGQLSWSGFHADEKRNRVPLPTYNFERHRYWVERQKQMFDSTSSRAPLRKNPDIAEWFYVPSWKRLSSLGASRPPPPDEKACWLVFADSCGISSRLLDRLEQHGHQVVRVVAGDRFAKSSEGIYSIDPRQSDDYTALLNEVRAAGVTPTNIVHLWNVTPDSEHPSIPEFFEQAQYRGFYSLLFLAQALGKQDPIDSIVLTAVSNNTQDVTGEESICPEKATLLAACKVIPQEYQNITCRSIDILTSQPRGMDEISIIDCLFAEITEKPSAVSIAHRRSHRWEQTFEPIRLQAAEGSIKLCEGGVYLITGGLGGVGLLLAEHLAQAVKAKLVLTSHSHFPVNSEWEEWLSSHDEQEVVSRKIRRLQAIEEAGGEVVVFSADVADEEAMRQVVERTREQFGEINGVIHAAGIVGEKAKCAIQNMSTSECERQFRPKAYGLFVLEKVLEDIELDFCLLLSSLASVLGGLGFFAYSAGNLFMDAFACKHNQTKRQTWTSVNYDGWLLREEQASGTGFGSILAQLAMRPGEALETFNRIVSSGIAPQVAVSTAKLQARMDQWIGLESLREAETLDHGASISLHQRPDLHTSFVGPTNETEQIIAGIWQELLGIDKIGIHDSFFELGGHSLLAVQLASRLRGALHAEISLRSMFEKPTIYDFATSIIGANEAQASKQAPALRRVSRDGHLPLSFAQERLWIVEQMEPGNPAYNNPKAIRLHGKLNVIALEQALNEIVGRHESLRTSFANVGGRPVQVITDSLTMKIAVDDLSDLPQAEREVEMHRLATAEARRPFNLQTEPVMRANLLRLDEQDHTLILVLHHIVSDAWSMAVLVREVSMLYEAYCTGAPSPLPDLAIQYADFAAWQREWLQGEAFDDLQAYWKSKLANLPTLQMPTDRPRQSVQTYEGANQYFMLPKTLTDSLKDLSNRHDVTLFMTLLAVFQVLLNRYTGQEDIVIGTDFANRSQTETEGLIGLFINQLVLRTDLSDNPTFKELLGRVRRVALDAYAHQDFPFEKLVEALNPQRDMSRTPIVQVKIVMLNVPTSSLELPGLTLNPQEFYSGIARFDLTLFITDSEQGLLCSFQYNTDLFDAATITLMASHFETLLQSCVLQCQARLSDLEMNTESELRQRMIDQEQREESKLDSFKKIKRRAVSLPKSELARMGLLYPDKRLPLVIEPAVNDVDPAEWAKENLGLIELKLSEYGAILFRNFDVGSARAFERFARSICSDLFAENGEHRKTVSGNVYTPVFYPPEKRLLWHNENSFNHNWPRKIWFGCLTPAEQGGETPIVDSRRVFSMIDPKIVEQFMRKGIMYTRNYGDGLGLDWQTVFQSSSRAEVEAHCRLALIEFDWKAGDRLRTRSIRPAVVKHPKTGEMVWFNQAQHWHTACLDVGVREALLSSVEEEDLPRNCYYGDGSPIEDSVIEEILDVYRQLEVSFPWRRRDVLMLDNLLTAHGRNPFLGERKMLVTMGEMANYGDV